jgi:hypothetical protein
MLRLLTAGPSLTFPLHRISMPCTALATLPSPFHCGPTQGFSYAHLCVSCHSISVTLHPLLLSSLPLHGKSHHCRNYSYPLLALPSHFNSIPRLFCSTQSATLPFSSMSYLRYAVSVLTFLRCSVPRPFSSFPFLRISAQFVAFAVTMLICAFLCHRVSVLFYASSQPFCSSAQLRCPYFSTA